MCLQNFIKLFQTVSELNFTFFRIWTSAKPRPIANIIWLSLGLHHVNINVYAKFHHKFPLSSRDRTFFIFFRIWSSAKPRPIKNVISQSLGLDLDNINVYAKVYQNIPLSSRDRAILTFQNLALGKVSTNDKCHFAICWTRGRQYQCVCQILSKYSKWFKSYRHFSRTGLVTKSSQTGW